MLNILPLKQNTVNSWIIKSTIISDIKIIIMQKQMPVKATIQTKGSERLKMQVHFSPTFENGHAQK